MVVTALSANLFVVILLSAILIVVTLLSAILMVVTALSANLFVVILLSAILMVVTALSANCVADIPLSLTDRISDIIVNVVSSTRTSIVLLSVPDFIKPLPATRSPSVYNLDQLPSTLELTSKFPVFSNRKPILLVVPKNKCEFVSLTSAKLLVSAVDSKVIVFAVVLLVIIVYLLADPIFKLPVILAL